MGFMIRQIAPTAKLSDERVLQALDHVIPQETIRAVIRELNVGRQRCRKLPAEVTILLPIVMNLFPREALQRVLSTLLTGLRFIWADPTFQPATKGAICQARYQMGVRPLVALFRRVCRPLATPATPGAFLFGLRVMALDATLEMLPDSPANGQYFGYPTNQHGPAAFPQALGVYLSECGTHAVIEAGFWPYATSAHTGARRLVRSVQTGMLVTWDCGLYSADLIVAVHDRGAHVLGRVPSNVRLPVAERLPDGSYLTWLSTGKDWQRSRVPRIQVRVLAYTLTDPHRPGCGQRHRLITTLLDPVHAPALELIVAYHERWEIELVIDEMDTHQRLAQHRLRSQKPVGVLQELYGLLLAHYAIRAVMVDAAAPLHLDPRRLSFVHAVHLICAALDQFQIVVPEQRPLLYQRLLTDIQRHRLPPRRERLNPRVVKRTRRKYPPKRPEHTPWPQPTCPFREAVLMLN